MPYMKNKDATNKVVIDGIYDDDLYPTDTPK